MEEYYIVIGSTYAGLFRPVHTYVKSLHKDRKSANKKAKELNERASSVTYEVKKCKLEE